MRLDGQTDTYSGVWSPNTDGPLRQLLESRAPKDQEHRVSRGGFWALCPSLPAASGLFPHQVPGPGVCGAEPADQPPCLPDTPTTSVPWDAEPAASSTAWAGLGWPKAAAARPVAPEPLPRPGRVPGQGPWVHLQGQTEDKQAGQEAVQQAWHRGRRQRHRVTWAHRVDICVCVCAVCTCMRVSVCACVCANGSMCPCTPVHP